MASFSENSLFEQGRFNDPFYVTGSKSRIGEEPGSFSSALRDKTQLKVTFPVKNKVKMLANSSSIYYYDIKNGQWNIPQKSKADLTGFSGHTAFDSKSTVVGTSGIFTGIVIQTGTSGSIFVEDDKWFDTHGNSLGSGSIDIFNPIRYFLLEDRRQKILEESFPPLNVIKPDGWSNFLTYDMPNSVQRNSMYDTSNVETFTLPITEPFMIEKVVFEVPFCFGNGWFNDRTALTIMTSSAGDYTVTFYEGEASYDVQVKNLVADSKTFTDLFLNEYQFIEVAKSGSASVYNYGGPGITLSLFSEKPNGLGRIRDLVCRGFLTHEEDTKRDMKYVPVFDGKFQNFGDFDNFWWQLTTLGVDTNETEVDAVVSASYIGSSKFFTGSVIVKSEVNVSNGIRVMHTRTLKGYPEFIPGEEEDIWNYYFKSYEEGMSFVSGCLENEYVPLGDAVLTGIDAFGRGMTGFSPSGGSIFGGEFVTAGTDVIRRDGYIRNPSYIPEPNRTAILSYVSSSLTSFNQYYPESNTLGLNEYYASNLKVPCYYFIGSRRESPYLIYPGEKLTLSVSKERPAFVNFKANFSSALLYLFGQANILSSSYLMDLKDPEGHDVQLNTGDINITFYGSYVREGNKYIP